MRPLLALLFFFYIASCSSAPNLDDFLSAFMTKMDDSEGDFSARLLPDEDQYEHARLYNYHFDESDEDEDAVGVTSYGDGGVATRVKPKEKALKVKVKLMEKQILVLQTDIAALKPKGLLDFLKPDLGDKKPELDILKLLPKLFGAGIPILFGFIITMGICAFLVFLLSSGDGIGGTGTGTGIGSYGTPTTSYSAPSTSYDATSDSYGGGGTSSGSGGGLSGYGGAQATGKRRKRSTNDLGTNYETSTINSINRILVKANDLFGALDTGENKEDFSYSSSKFDSDFDQNIMSKVPTLQFASSKMQET